jgi:hypothetical protein
MGQKSRFRVYHTLHGDHVAVIEMDEDLLDPAAGIVDPDSLTLRGIKNGGVYTLLPLDDHTVTTLLRLQEIYKNITTTPAKLFGTAINRMDELILAVGLLFGEVEYVLVETKDDLDKIINPPKGDYTPKKVKYTVLGDLLKDATAKAGLTNLDIESIQEV